MADTLLLLPCRWCLNGPLPILGVISMCTSIEKIILDQYQSMKQDISDLRAEARSKKRKINKLYKTLDNKMAKITERMPTYKELQRNARRIIKSIDGYAKRHENDVDSESTSEDDAESASEPFRDDNVVQKDGKDADVKKVVKKVVKKDGGNGAQKNGKDVDVKKVAKKDGGNGAQKDGKDVGVKKASKTDELTRDPALYRNGNLEAIHAAEQ